MLSRHRAFTSVELIAVFICALVVGTVTTVSFDGRGHGSGTQARTFRDSTQLSQISQAIIVFSVDNDGQYVRPGLVDRLPMNVGGEVREIPGRGEEDVTRNTTAALYSAMIVQNYLTPEVVVSPVERNPRVAVIKDYAYDKYDPAADTYWDTAFVADLGVASNASYAHQPMFGKRMDLHWRNTMDAGAAVLGNRGPLHGEPDGRSYTSSPHGCWSGNVVYNDNHVKHVTEFAPKRFSREANAEVFDNLFHAEEGKAGADLLLSFTTKMSGDGPELQHD